MTPDAVVQCARGWIGTRFHHQGRLQKTSYHNGGVDCLGMLSGIAKALDLRDKEGLPLALHDETDYAHLPDTKHLRAKLDAVLYPIDHHMLAAADIVLLAIEGVPRHLALISTDSRGKLQMIHAYAQAHKVVEHPLNEDWCASIVQAYRLPHFM